MPANVLTNVGRAIVTGRLLGGLTGTTPGANAPIHIGWGIGTTDAVATDTALGSEAIEARTPGTASRSTTAVTNDTYQVQGTITCGGTSKTISEAALFDATKAEGGTVPVGNMFARGNFTGVALNVSDSIAFTFRWQLQ